jgi:hypothetical protein
VKEIVFSEEKKSSEMNECERDVILGYSFMMKRREGEKESLLKLWKCLVLIVKEGISKEKKKEERERLIGWKCVFEMSWFFLSSFSLFLFHSSIFFLFLFFCFIILIDNKWVLRKTSVVSEVKEIYSEYEKEVERRGKGEIVKRKVDKILFVNLLQIEFMLMEEEEEKKKFVKNNVLPVLPFLLCDEEKEREEEDSDEDVKNAIIFQFLCDYFLNDDSFRSLLLSDERKVVLDQTLLFSLRRDSPFTRRQCLNVLWYLFSHGEDEEVQLVIESGRMKRVVLKMKGKEEREEKVKVNGKDALRHCLSQYYHGERIPYRKKEGWKGEEIIREMMWMMEEEDVKETLMMSFPDGISTRYYAPSFN